MEKTMRLAAAMKYLKELEDEKRTLLKQESENSTYQMLNGSAPEIPEYNFKAVQGQLEKIDETVCNIRHAMNVANATKVVEGTGLTVDQILVTMAQTNDRLGRLQGMASKAKKSQPRFMGALENQTVIFCTNYDPEEVKCCYKQMREKLTNLQMALDLHNLSTEITFTSVVD